MIRVSFKDRSARDAMSRNEFPATQKQTPSLQPRCQKPSLAQRVEKRRAEKRQQEAESQRAAR